jgi:alkylation response protein AidB-like acyl-CoA dehydrogenase
MYFQDEPEHITMLRDSLRRFIEKEAPREKIRAWDKIAYFPRVELFDKYGPMGITGLTVEEQYGGAGIDIVAAIAVVEEFAKRGGAVAAPYIHCAFYGGLNIGENGSEAQKQEFLPKIARGELVFAYGLSEPDVGGDLASVTTTARLSADGTKVIVNGTKRWCTAIKDADWLFCLCKSDADAPRYQNLSMVLIPAKSPGITVHTIDHSCIRFAETTDTILEDVEVPVENVLGGPEGWNNGWKMLAGRALDVEKLETAACALGIAWAAVDDAWKYAQERKQFGKPISAHQAVRHSLVEAKTKLQACRHMLYHAAWLANEGRPCSVETSMAKLFIADTGVEIVMMCQRVMGAYGLAVDYDMERYLRDIVCFPIVGGSSNMQRNNIAARLRLAT